MVEKAKRLVIVVSEDKFAKAMMSMMMANTAANPGGETCQAVWPAAVTDSLIRPAM